MPWKTSNEFFLNPKVRFTQPSQFNDPFEGQVSVSGLLGHAEVMKPNFEHLDAFQGYIASLQDANQAVNVIYSEYAALCLASSKANLLMWAHYAQDHKGIMIEFDISHPFFQNWCNWNQKEVPSDSLLGHPLPVKYSQHRPNSMHHQSFFGPLLTKSLEWEYEGECRMFLLREDADEHIMCSEYDHNHEHCILLYSVPPDAISRVVIGCRAEENKQAIIDQLNHSFQAGIFDSRKLKVQEAVLHPDRFELIYRDLPRG